MVVIFIDRREPTPVLKMRIVVFSERGNRELFFFVLKWNNFILLWITSLHTAGARAINEARPVLTVDT